MRTTKTSDCIANPATRSRTRSEETKIEGGDNGATRQLDVLLGNYSRNPDVAYHLLHQGDLLMAFTRKKGSPPNVFIALGICVLGAAFLLWGAKHGFRRASATAPAEEASVTSLAPSHQSAPGLSVDYVLRGPVVIPDPYRPIDQGQPSRATVRPRSS